MIPEHRHLGATRFPSDLTDVELDFFFTLDDAELECQSASNRGSDSLSVQVINHAAAISRALSRSRFARPYIWRLMSLSRLILPST